MTAHLVAPLSWKENTTTTKNMDLSEYYRLV